MWPLVCHEVGLSYDQEEKIRQCQRLVLADSQTWVHRHTALATNNVVESAHSAISGVQQAAKNREKSLMNILTPEQRVKFLAWASRRADVIRRLAESNIKPPSANVAGESGEEFETSPNRHVAVNLYIIDHQLSKVKQRAPENTPHSLVHPAKLKKLSKRPSLESLAISQSESDGIAKMNRASSLTSFPSTGSLKRSMNDVIMGDEDSGDLLNSAASGVTPDSSQVEGHAAIMEVLKDILPIVPKSALQYTPNLNHAHPPTAVRSQPQFSSTSKRSRGRKPQRSSSTSALQALSRDVDVGDIPMPTPVSVLLQTEDDFISPVEYQEEEPMDPMTSGYDDGLIGDMTMPEPVVSYGGAPIDTAGSSSGRGLMRNRHSSAPQLHSLYQGSISPSPHDPRSYPSLLPTRMAMIPESSGFLGNSDRAGDIADFGLDDMPDLGETDWAIGMDLDLNEGTA